MSIIKIIGTRLYQWEVGRQLQIIPLPNHTVACVHFSNPGDLEALVVKPKELNGMIVADIPNILLQNGKNIIVYTVDVSETYVETLTDCELYVRRRSKPSNYVYTEVEILNFETLKKRIEEIEKNGVSEEQIAAAMENYLKENPINGLPDVSDTDNGKILRVEGGKWEVVELPTYGGDYAVTPTVDGQTLETAQKYMTDNLTVKSIPYYDVGNNSGGSTVYIGTEIDIE